MYAGKHDNLFTKILSAPGLLMQRMTTKEPDDGQIEIAIAAVKDALHDEFPEFETYQPEGEDYRIVGAAPASDAAEAPADADERESSVQGAAE